MTCVIELSVWVSSSLKRFVGPGGFLVAWATKYIIRWSGICVRCFPVDLLLSHNLQHKLEGSKEKRAGACMVLL
jgi:hypothetical protein